MSIPELKEKTPLPMRLANLLEEKGYQIQRISRIRGKSETVYNADIVAKFQAPFHEFSLALFIVKPSLQISDTSKDIGNGQKENNDINPEVIAQYVKMTKDLDVSQIILATTVNFTASAVLLAQNCKNLDLWNGKKLQSLLGETQGKGGLQKNNSIKKAIETKISNEFVVKYAKKSAEKHSKSGLFGKGKITEKVTSIHKQYYPYYDVDYESEVSVTEKVGGFFGKKERINKTIRTRTSIDALNGSIVHVTTPGVSYQFHFLDNLSDDAVDIFWYVSSVDKFEQRSLAGVLSISSTKISNAIMELVTYGVLRRIKPSPVTYEVLIKYPKNPDQFASLLEKYTASEIKDRAKIIEPTISQESVKVTLNKYWRKVQIKSFDLVYYPYFKINYERDDNTRRSETIDGRTGLRTHGLSE